MCEQQFESALRDAVTEVLETMFFASVGEETAEGCAGDSLIATLRFVGSPSGSFSLAVSREAAVEMAANFLGCEEDEGGDEAGSGQPEEVVREMANMVCGSFLSRVEGGSHFELEAPRSAAEFPDEQQRRSFELENGRIEIGLTTVA